MIGLLVRCRRVRRSVRFYQDKPRRIILLLDDIEPGNPRLLDALPRIRQRCLFKGFHIFRLHLDMHMNNQHTAPFGFVLNAKTPSWF